jgi:predicted ATPase
VLESGLLREDTDAWRLDGPLPPLAIPSSLYDSFMARLDRMAPVKEVAQVGAAIGREFSSRLLAPVLDMNAATLEVALSQLVDAGLLARLSQLEAQSRQTRGFPRCTVERSAPHRAVSWRGNVDRGNPR